MRRAENALAVEGLWDLQDLLLLRGAEPRSLAVGGGSTLTMASSRLGGPGAIFLTQVFPNKRQERHDAKTPSFVVAAIACATACPRSARAYGSRVEGAHDLFSIDLAP